MRQNGPQRRGRGRNNGRRSQNNAPNRNYESNGPDVKIRGTASHVAEKYAALARDASVSGDRIAAENYLQHAEHYNRIVAVIAEQAAERQAAEQERRERNNRNRQRENNETRDNTGDAAVNPVADTNNEPEKEAAAEIPSADVVEISRGEEIPAANPSSAETESSGERSPRRRNTRRRPPKTESEAAINEAETPNDGDEPESKSNEAA